LRRPGVPLTCRITRRTVRNSANRANRSKET
jgi:hypothetical protein